jgi:hypothetical protein
VPGKSGSSAEILPELLEGPVIVGTQQAYTFAELRQVACLEERVASMGRQAPRRSEHLPLAMTFSLSYPNGLGSDIFSIDMQHFTLF